MFDRRAVSMGLVLVLAWAAQPAWGQAVNFWISCEGTESAGGGAQLYQYELRNVTAGALILTDLYVATDDLTVANYANVTVPPNWNWLIEPGNSGWSNNNPPVKTAHAGNAPLPTGLSAGAIHFSALAGGAINVPPGGTVLFGFDNPNESVNMDWWTPHEQLPGANWLTPVAGPAGVFTNGPVHGPTPEPGTLVLVALGGLAMMRRRRR